MVPLMLSLTLLLGAGALVYAMRARRDLLELAARADTAWLALDDLLTERRDRLTTAIESLRAPGREPPGEIERLERSLASQQEIRATRELLRLGSYERQIRTLTARIRDQAPQALAGVEAVEQAILERTDAYDAAASLYNIRIQRLPVSLIARLEGLRPWPLIEFVEPFPQQAPAGGLLGRVSPE
jgi:hypothetical protein